MLALLLLACTPTSSLPLPKTGPHVGEEAVIVPYPPPPAKVQVIPDRPEKPKDLVWIDGQWLWRSQRWIWQEGKWEEPHKNGYYAIPMTIMVSDGSIRYFAGSWHDGAAK